ncbi:unnamed protein product, partial [Polarella glacialis]
VDRLSQLAATSRGRSWWHIAAHSEPGTGRLIFEDENGGAHLVPLSALSTSCTDPPLGALVLACEGEQAGRAILAGGASFAIVSSGSLRDLTARRFASHFYRRLLAAWPSELPQSAAAAAVASEGIAVRKAFDVARQALLGSPCPGTRSEAANLALLERCMLSPCEEPVRSLSAPWVPVALSTRGAAGSRLVADADEAAGSPQLMPKEEPTPPQLPSQSSSDEFRAGKLEDCEDFVGRGAELHRLLQLLGTPGGRRVVVLNGPAGSGKSALGAELCRFATAPGRRFSPVDGKRRLSYLSLRDSWDSGRGADAAVACTRLAMLAAADGLTSPGPRACLIVDHAEPELGWCDEFVQELLDRHQRLCLFLVRRTPLYRLEGEGGDRWKPLNMALGALPDAEVAQLFLQRLHRPLFPADFERQRSGDSRGAQPLRQDDLMRRRLACLPVVAACAGRPKAVVRLASQ